MIVIYFSGEDHSVLLIKMDVLVSPAVSTEEDLVEPFSATVRSDRSCTSYEVVFDISIHEKQYCIIEIYRSI